MSETRESGGRGSAIRPTIMRAANRLVGLLLRSPLHRLLGENLTLFEYTGRKSGKRYAFPLGYHREGRTIALFAGNPWWKNFRQPAPVTLYLGGHPVRGTAQVVGGPEESFGWFLAYLRALPKYAKFYDVALDPEGRPDPASVRRASEAKVVIRIDLDSDAIEDGRAAAGRTAR